MKPVVKLTVAVLTLIGVTFALLSCVFCTSWYADEELRKFVTEDDAGLVEILAFLAVLCGGSPLIAMAWARRGWPKKGVLLALVAVTGLGLGQFLAVESLDSCISFNALKTGQILLPVNHLWGG